MFKKTGRLRSVSPRTRKLLETADKVKTMHLPETVKSDKKKKFAFDGSDPKTPSEEKDEGWLISNKVHGDVTHGTLPEIRTSSRVESFKDI